MKKIHIKIPVKLFAGQPLMIQPIGNHALIQDYTGIADICLDEESTKKAREFNKLIKKQKGEKITESKPKGIFDRNKLKRLFG